jgi:hypothetical protein
LPFLSKVIVFFLFSSSVLDGSLNLFVSKASATASNNSFIPSADKAETNLKVAFIDFA